MRLSTFVAISEVLNEVPRLLPIEEPWFTPQFFIDAILRGLGIKKFCLDPASPNPPTVPCKRFYTERDGGLWLPWDGDYIWCNPPYDQMAAWTTKLVAEHAEGRARRVVALVPAFIANLHGGCSR